jgi:hypothetical protein
VVGGALVGGALVVALLAGIGDGTNARPPATSSDDTGGGGLSAWRELLDDAGYEVDAAEEPPSAEGLDPAATAVLLDPGTLADREAEALAEHLAAGGRLVIGGEVDGETIERVAGSPMSRTTAGTATTAVPLAPAREVAGVASVAASGTTRFEATGGALPILGVDSSVLAALAGEGSGEVVVLADATPLQNDRLALADNALFALRLAGAPERPVTFVESVEAVHASGLAALPGSWRWTFLGLLAAALTLIAARVRRFGPPDPPGRELAPSRREYLDAVAASLARTRDPVAASEPVRRAAREQLARRAAVSPELDRAELERLGPAFSLSEAEVAAIAPGDGERGDPIDAGRALSKLYGTTEVRR